MSDFSETVYGGQKAKTAALGEGKFDAQLATFEDGTKGVLKVRPFSTEAFRSIDRQTTPLREVAAYLLDSKVLGFGVVPETLKVKWKGRTASIQSFVRSALPPRGVVPDLFKKDSSRWKFQIAKFFLKVDRLDMTKIILFDLITNNVDRHGKNVLIEQPSKHVWAIDNGLCFGRYYRNYRSVFHKYMFYAQFHVPPSILLKLKSIKREDLNVLAPYLAPVEVEETFLRIRFVIEHADRLAWKRMSGGLDIKSKDEPFPSYKAWFLRQQADANAAEPALVYAP